MKKTAIIIVIIALIIAFFIIFKPGTAAQVQSSLRQGSVSFWNSLVEPQISEFRPLLKEGLERKNLEVKQEIKKEKEELKAEAANAVKWLGERVKEIINKR